MQKKVDLAEKLSLFDDFWSPKIVGELNSQQVKLAKLKGEFVWHDHDAEDEMFLVLKGRLLIKLRSENFLLRKASSLSCRAVWRTSRWQNTRST